MFLIDDLMLSPGRFVLWVFRQVHDAAREEMSGEKKRITAELGQLHAMLEGGRLSEAEFDRLEGVLLDRLDALEEQNAEGEDGVDDGPEA
jgi:hypothetical protein